MFWKKFINKKPKKDGWYLCTVLFPFTKDFDGSDVYQTYVMDLYWYCDKQKFLDNRVGQIFDMYEVIGYGQNNKVKILKEEYHYDRTYHVVAWRRLPKPYKDRNVKYLK